MQQIESLRQTLRVNQQNPLARLKISRIIGESKLTMEISPCTWMYKNYPFQTSVTLEGGGEARLIDRTLNFEKATEADCVRMLDSIKLIPCKHCGKPAFDPECVDTNRDGACEACFIKELDAEFDAAHQNELKRIARLDAKHLKKGFTHRVDAWIHPPYGEDYEVSFYVKTLDKEMIAAELKKLKSVKHDDYRIVALADPVLADQKM